MRCSTIKIGQRKDQEAESRIDNKALRWLTQDRTLPQEADEDILEDSPMLHDNTSKIPGEHHRFHLDDKVRTYELFQNKTYVKKYKLK